MTTPTTADLLSLLLQRQTGATPEIRAAGETVARRSTALAERDLSPMRVQEFQDALAAPDSDKAREVLGKALSTVDAHKDPEIAQAWKSVNQTGNQVQANLGDVRIGNVSGSNTFNIGSIVNGR